MTPFSAIAREELAQRCEQGHAVDKTPALKGIARNGSAAGLVVALVLVLGCSGAASTALPDDIWPMYQFDATHNAAFDSPQWTYRWRVKLDGKVNGALSIVGHTLYVETLGKSLYALDPQTGALRWHAALPNIAMNAPIVAGDIVVAGTGSSEHLTDLPKFPIVGQPAGDDILAFSADNGKPMWKFHTVGENMPTGVYLQDGGVGRFVFGNGDGHAYALDYLTGRLIWATPIPGTSWMSSMAFDGVRAYAIASDASISYYNWALAAGKINELRLRTALYALQPKDGKILWTAPFGNADCSPTVAGGMVYSEDDYPADSSNQWIVNTVEGVDATTGRLVWQYSAPRGNASGYGSAESSIAGVYDSGVLYQSLPWYSHFIAFDGKTGRILWDVKTHDAIKMSAVIKDGLVYVGDTSGYLYVIRATDGTVLRTIKFPDIFTCSPPVIVGQTLFVADKSVLYAIPLDDLLSGTIPA